MKLGRIAQADDGGEECHKSRQRRAYLDADHPFSLASDRNQASTCRLPFLQKLMTFYSNSPHGINLCDKADYMPAI
ncbi:MAG: hypothetical protein ACPIOQ_64325, partial [Promethearchaeia archaeon]